MSHNNLTKRHREKTRKTQTVEKIKSSVLSAEEKYRVLFEFNNTQVAYDKSLLIHQLFEMQAEKTPDAIVISYKDQNYSYQQLNLCADQLAELLLTHNIKADDCIAICVERGFAMVVGLLAILKAGAAYVPLDPKYPVDRLTYMLEDSAPKILLSQPSLTTHFAHLNASVKTINLHDYVEQFLQSANTAKNAITDDITSPKEQSGVQLPFKAISSDNLAYIIYTSGSTGKPKGVAIEHRNAVNFILWAQKEFSSAADGCFYFSTSLNFDLSIYELFVPLSMGGRIRIVQDALGIANAPKDSALFNGVPSAISALLDLNAIADSVKTINLAGEALKQNLVEKIFSQTQVEYVCNLYGPSETTTYSTWVRMNRADGFIAHIGRPIANTQVYILDEQENPVAVGETGEIHIGGLGVARGYLNRPQLTAEKFIVNPYSRHDNARMYKTGDLGRWLPSGDIEYLGRNDYQIKLRGFRIELREIETQLESCTDVKQALVVAREDTPGDERLVAYLIASEQKTNVKKIRTQLEKSLPGYMIPSALIFLEAFPLTPNGKVDRAKLPAPEQQSEFVEEIDTPQGIQEELLADIWRELLNVKQVSRNSSFFELGGHSLLAVRLIARIHQQFSVEVELHEFFDLPTICGLAGLVRTAKRSEWLPFSNNFHGKNIPLSKSQQRLWFLTQLNPNAGLAYHMANAYQLNGEVDTLALQSAFSQIVQRHESLRTNFVSLAEGLPAQIIQQQIDFKLNQFDLSQSDNAQIETLAKEVLSTEINRPFDLTEDCLLRVVLLKLSNQQYQMLIITHHIISDGWSMGVLLNELSQLYLSNHKKIDSNLAPLNYQFSDFTAWESQFFQGGRFQQQLDFWINHLTSAPALLEIPSDHPRPLRQSYRGARVDFSIDVETTRNCLEFCREHQITPFMLLLSAWSILLMRLSGQNDLVIGTPVANRQRPEVEDLIGFFVNTLAIRVQLDAAWSVEKMLLHVKNITLQAFEHQELPLDIIVEELNPQRSMSHNPIFQNLLAFDNTSASQQVQLDDVDMVDISSPQSTAIADISMLLSLQDKQIKGGIEYALDLFEEATIKRFLGYFQSILSSMLHDDSIAISQIKLLQAEDAIDENQASQERHKILHTFNQTQVDFPKESLIQHIFEQQVKNTPNAIALVFENQTLTYAELNESANQLAYYIISQGIQADDCVAIGLTRSASNIISVLATLKAGAAYLPLEPSFPAERIAFIIKDAKPKLLLTEQTHSTLWPQVNCPIIVLEDEMPQISQQPVHNPIRKNLNAKNLAYIMYTSGSTGEPKGVMVEHRNVLRLVINNYFAPLTTEDCVAHCANPAFDASTWEIWSPLLNGARLLIVSAETVLDSKQLNQLLIKQGTTAMWLTAGLFNEYVDDLEDAFSQLNYLMVGGDVLDPQTVAKAAGKANSPKQIINGYGPTETTTFATTYLISGNPSSSRAIPIGKPIGNTQIYILDAHLEPVPLGIIGEIYIAGDGVARGYLNQVELTEQRFINNPFCQNGNGRMYKTGDLGRWRSDGNIEYKGRNDFQIKLRGYRIEPEEIEYHLSQIKNIREALVIAVEYPGNDKRLVGYLLSAVPDKVSEGDIKQQLKTLLPDYMIPSDFVVLKHFPLTSNGKVDRRALPMPKTTSKNSSDQQHLQLNSQEKLLADIWSDLLNRSVDSPTDNFFDLGGHSLLATRLNSRVRQAYGIEYSLKNIFESPSLAQMTTSILNMKLSVQDSVLESLLNDLDCLDDEQAKQQLEQEKTAELKINCSGEQHD